MSKLSIKISLIFIISISYIGPSQAIIKCWKNDVGTRECSFTVPLKYVGREIQIMNGQGQVIRTIPADKTPEEKKQAAKLAKIEAEKKRIKDERRRQDIILLNTFTTVDDITLSRDTKLIAIESIIKISESNRSKRQKALDKHTRNAGNFERKSNKVPKPILKDIERTKAQIAKIDTFIESRKQEKLAIFQKYERFITRFKELKSLRPH